MTILEAFNQENIHKYKYWITSVELCYHTSGDNMKIIKRILLVLCLGLIITAGVIYYLNSTIIRTPARVVFLDTIQKAENTYMEAYRQNLLNEFNTYYTVNNDYQGMLTFDSGIISEKVVLAEDNDKYLRKDFNLKRDDEGTVFMDMDCNLDSRNITMYGHYVYYNSKAKFSPLHLLAKEKNYESNKYITFKLKEEIRTYEIFAVYYYDWRYEDAYFYNTADFQTAEGFQRHVNNSIKRALYKTNVKVNDDDNLLTLQTCVRNKKNSRLIVVAKEIDRK